MKQEIIRIDLDGVNSYLGKEGDNYILFDTGGHLMKDKQSNDRRALLLDELNKAGCHSDNLKLIVLTHGDSDHSANATFLRDTWHTAIAMHPDDVPLVDNPSLDTVMKNFRFRSPVLRVTSFMMKNFLRKITAKTMADFKSFKPDILLREGDSLSKYGFDAEIVHIPGHTDGSIGIVTASKEMITGDILANMKSPESSVNASDFKALDLSIKRIKSMNVRRFYPGHGEPFTSLPAE